MERPDHGCRYRRSHAAGRPVPPHQAQVRSQPPSGLWVSRRRDSPARVGAGVRRDPPPAAATGRGGVVLAVAAFQEGERAIHEQDVPVNAGRAGCRGVGFDDLEDAPVLLAVSVMHLNRPPGSPVAQHRLGSPIRLLSNARSARARVIRSPRPLPSPLLLAQAMTARPASPAPGPSRSAQPLPASRPEPLPGRSFGTRRA